MFTLGMTGGIGSGKSTVAAMFARLGIYVVDADDVARAVVEPGGPCLHSIGAHFGETILLADGSLNRARLRETIFSDLTEKSWLENLTHPVIREQITAQLDAAESPYRILVSPLIFEKNQRHWVERVLVVDIPEIAQKNRSMARDKVSEDNITAIMQSQLSRKQRCQMADDIIDNSQPLEHTLQQVHKLHNFYLSLQ